MTIQVSDVPLHPLQDVQGLFYPTTLLIFNKGDFFMKKFNLKALVVCSLLAALSIVFGKFLAIPVGDSMRFSFENTPLFVAGFIFGPVWGCLTAIVADLVGGLMVYGGNVNIIITLGAAIIGFSGGIFYRLLKTKPFFRIAISVIIAHVIGSIFIKSLGIHVFNGSPYIVLLGWRSINYVIMSIIDTLVLYFLFKNKSFIKIAESLK